MSKLRSVNTHFWSDNYIIDLDPTEKLLFLYLLTNENTNMLGIYELHVRKIAFETGIDKDMVLKIFDRFNEDNKAAYIDGYVCLYNFTKHQSYNKNMKVSAVNSFNELPLTVRKQPFIEPLLKALKPLPKGSEPIAEYELELERELEYEKERESELSKPTLSEVSDYFIKQDSTTHEAEKFYDYYQSKGWKIGGEPMHDWKACIRNWLRRDRKKGQEFTYKEMLVECDKSTCTTDDFKMIEKDRWVKK